MTSLQSFPFVRENLRRGRRETVALHKFVYESEGDRDNRKRLRTFEGFAFDENDEKYIAKCKYIEKNLTASDLTTICNFLNINHHAADLKEYIFLNLKRGSLLFTRAGEDESDCEDEEDDDDMQFNDDDAKAEIQNRSNDDRRKNKDSDVFCSIDNLDVRDVKDDRKTPTLPMSRFALSFRDIEDSIRAFDGSEQIPIEAWIEEFEETAAVMCWDNFQKFVFAKKSLKGVAKRFILSERGITSWRTLKDALVDEFRTTVSSAQIHKALIERQMKNNENIQEYFFEMKDLASRGNVDDSSLIQYIIDGKSVAK